MNTHIDPVFWVTNQERVMMPTTDFVDADDFPLQRFSAFALELVGTEIPKGSRHRILVLQSWAKSDAEFESARQLLPSPGGLPSLKPQQ